MLFGRKACKVKKSSREQRFRPELILQGAKRNTAEEVEEIVGAPEESREVFLESARTKEEMGNDFLDIFSEKSSEGRTPRVWEAERGFRGYISSHHREGSQTLRVGLLKEEANFLRRFREGAQKRVNVPGAC